ncbi:FAD-dependent oxidoreductase [Pyxidicoccus parkwayensis]|uniref:FAD-dependent oxidoreductase n=1 Tax=Pyxidicoccus parkwayensis TaxID=2813578 RepID=A0ABX7NN64_9BACT|nr:FAD-dependent oxidoreductase [Pyxidicoccus parkwaysis]QSQ18841.1 FAD-dependent oxidoreductase [Pyxidicoccus parkwaysis]
MSSPSRTTRRTRVAVLGAGPAGLATAHALSRTPELRARFEVTVYQSGWRAGGKLTSGRKGSEQTVSLNGTHFLFGCYDETLTLLREAYDDLLARGDSRCGTFEEALLPRDILVCMQQFQGRWTHWRLALPRNGLRPGTPGSPVLPEQYFWMVLGWIRDALGKQGAVGGSPRVLPEGWGSELLQRGLRLLGSDARSSLRARGFARVLRLMRGGAGRLLMGRAETDLGVRRLWVLLDLAWTCAIGLLEDGVLGPEGFDVCDDEDLRAWLARHGASELARSSPLITTWYDAVAAYEDGDVSRPNLSAAVSLKALFRALFAYRGAFSWQLRAETGESVIAPIFEMLRNRGVRFRFFHRVHELIPEEGHIARILMERQAELKSGDPDSYEPFIEVHGRRAWPDRPLSVQLATPGVEGNDLESFYTGWRGTRHELRHGEDFDHVVFALPVGVVPFHCRRLMEEQASWRRMVEHVQAVETQSLRLNFVPDLAGLGWPGPVPIVSSFVRDFSTWEDAGSLAAVECWPEGHVPGAVATVFGPLRAPRVPPGPEDVDYPKRQERMARAAAQRFVREDAGALWPGVASPEDPRAVDWTKLVDLGQREGAARFEAMEVRANCGPVERYTLARAGGLKHRLRANGSGYANLFLAGDWVRNGLDIGCVEGAVMAGRQAADALMRDEG